MCLICTICSFIVYYIDTKFKNETVKTTIKISDIPKIIKKLTTLFWLCAFYSGLSYIALFSIMMNIQGLLVHNYGISRDLASKLYSLPFIMGAICVIFVGKLTDVIG